MSCMCMCMWLWLQITRLTRRVGRALDEENVADDIAAYAAKAIGGWVIHPDDMDLTRLLEQTRLQCWTLKPAWPRAALAT